MGRVTTAISMAAYTSKLYFVEIQIKALCNAVCHEGTPVSEFCGEIELLRDRLATGGKTIDDNTMVATALNELPPFMESVQFQLHLRAVVERATYAAVQGRFLN